MNADRVRIHAIVLAAGKSSRMSPLVKQLYPHPKTKRPLLEHCLNEITKLPKLSSSTLILGAHSETILTELSLPESIEVKVNPHYESGLGSSISCGMTSILDRIRATDNAAVLLILPDQPEVTHSFLESLICRHDAENSSAITVSHYKNGTMGPPVIFGMDHFEALKQLKGEKGAKPIIQQHADRVTKHQTPEFCGYDLDTEADLIRFEAENR